MPNSIKVHFYDIMSLYKMRKWFLIVLNQIKSGDFMPNSIRLKAIVIAFAMTFLMPLALRAESIDSINYHDALDLMVVRLHIGPAIGNVYYTFPAGKSSSLSSWREGDAVHFESIYSDAVNTPSSTVWLVKDKEPQEGHQRILVQFSHEALENLPRISRIDRYTDGGAEIFLTNGISYVFAPRSLTSRLGNAASRRIANLVGVGESGGASFLLQQPAISKSGGRITS